MINKRDFKFIPEKPDANFSPEHNRLVIERTIAKYEAKRAERYKKFKEGVGERAEAIASFFQHIQQNGHNNLDKYFGPKMLAKLRGADIVDSLRAKANVIERPSPFYVEGGMVKNMKGVIVGKEVSDVKKKPQRKKKLG